MQVINNRGNCDGKGRGIRKHLTICSVFCKPKTFLKNNLLIKSQESIFK